MRRGLVIGKFMPIHNGHINLIKYGLSHCDLLTVWVCVSNHEKLSGKRRIEWVRNVFKDYPKVNPVLFEYDENILPNTSESSMDVSQRWSEVIKKEMPDIDMIISAEKYGDYVAEFLGIEHKYFNSVKEVSATKIRMNPYDNWEYIPDEVKPNYSIKVCLLGTESTGKSTLAQKLAEYFGVDYVSEVGRELVENSNECTIKDLHSIAEGHAYQILQKEKLLQKLLFIDTDITITKSYSKSLFNHDLIVEDWVLLANDCDLYLYLENDVPFVQDGTRLSLEERNRLNVSHKNELKNSSINYNIIEGNWDKRFADSIKIIEEFMLQKD